MSSQTDDERRAWDDLVEAVEAFDKTSGTSMNLVRSIDALIEAKVAERADPLPGEHA